MPRVDLKAKLSAMNEKVKKARMPSPHELREGYLNSSFHKSFQQPLAVRTKEMDDPELLEQRQVDYLGSQACSSLQRLSYFSWFEERRLRLSSLKPSRVPLGVRSSFSKNL